MTLPTIRLGDAVLAAAILVLAVVEIAAQQIDRAPLALATALVACAALVFRRSAPVAVVVICVGAQTINQWAGVDVSNIIAPVAYMAVAIYTMARHCDLRRALIGEAVAVVLSGTTLIRDGSDWFWGAMVLGAPFLVGLALRISANRSDELSGQMSELQQRRDAEVAAAIADERARIARDLHDVIAHSVTVMLVQAGAAEGLLGRDTARVGEALSAIQESGRQALTDMGTLVGMLRENEGDDGIGLAPQPGLDRLPMLVRQSSGEGLDVTLDVHGIPVPVPPGIQVSAYRIVQEALTNVRRHSSARHARVLLTYAHDRLSVEVCDDGHPTGDNAGGQRGIVGMHERVAIYGGEFDAGPTPTGFRVVASMPIASAA